MRNSTLLIAIALLPFFASAEIEFTGFVGVSENPYFNLTDPESKTNAWVSVSQSFQGYIVTKFDRPSKTLTLEKGTHSISLRLRGSSLSTDDSGSKLNPISRLEGLELAVELARQGDDQISDLLARFHGASDPKNAENPSAEMAVRFLKSRLLALAQERKQMAEAITEKQPNPER